MLDVSEGFLNLMTDDGDIREDIKIPDNDLGKEIQAKYEGGDQFMVTVLGACSQEMAIAHKNMTNKK